MAHLTTFYPYILPYCPGVPEPAVDQALRDAAEEFCRRSRAIRDELDPITTQPAVGEYDLDPVENGTLVAEVLDVVLQEGVRKTVLDPGRPERRDATAVGNPEEFWQPRPALLRIHPTPVNAGTLRVTAATKPAPNTETLDDRLFNEWRTGLCAGALSRLYLTPNQPYSSPEAAGVYAGIFASEIARAVSQSGQGIVRARLRIVPHA